MYIYIHLCYNQTYQDCRGGDMQNNKYNGPTKIACLQNTWII